MFWRTSEWPDTSLPDDKSCRTSESFWKTFISFLYIYLLKLESKLWIFGWQGCFDVVREFKDPFRYYESCLRFALPAVEVRKRCNWSCLIKRDTLLDTQAAQVEHNMDQQQQHHFRNIQEKLSENGQLQAAAQTPIICLERKLYSHPSSRQCWWSWVCSSLCTPNTHRNPLKCNKWQEKYITYL